MSDYNIILVLGPTASGKTTLAVQLAAKLDGEILSADSRQVYRGLDIGSGKDLDEYQDVPYHLIDIVDPGYEFSVFDFQKCFFKAFGDISQRGKTPILAGGTALYIDSVLDNYQLPAVPRNLDLRQQLESFNEQQLVEYLLKLKPKQHNTTDLLDRERLIRAIEIAQVNTEDVQDSQTFPKLVPLILGIQRQRNDTRQLITERLKYRLENGLIEEVQRLFDEGLSWQVLHFYGLEYRMIAQYLQNQIDFNTMFHKLNTAIHQFAKKQDTWLRRLERNGKIIHWIDGTDNKFEQALQIINESDLKLNNLHCS